MRPLVLVAPHPDRKKRDESGSRRVAHRPGVAILDFHGSSGEVRMLLSETET